MVLKHQLDEWPPFPELVLLGLQWLAISIPGIIIVGKVVTALQCATFADQSVYLQKLSFVVSTTLLAQVVWGHRLPLILGPSTVLLIGVVASSSFDPGAVYSSIIIGGLILSALGLSGLFGYIQRLFTPRVVAATLILIALTLTPTVVSLVRTPQGGIHPVANLVFAIAMTISMFVAHRLVKSVWKSTLILWAMIAGSIMYCVLSPQPFSIETIFNGRLTGFFFVDLTTKWSLEPGVLISFLLCFVALSINDLGSIQSMKEMLNPPDMDRRTSRGILFTGLGNILAGFLGVVGPVNFSLSPGVIAATGNASRLTLIPTAVFLLFLSSSPLLLGILGSIPPAIIGSSLTYILWHQFVAGIRIAFPSRRDVSLGSGLIMGVPCLVGTVIAFLPTPVLQALPGIWRPIVGNGFVMGIFSALILEHLTIVKHRSNR
jgi:xanthine/uracil permease